MVSNSSAATPETASWKTICYGGLFLCLLVGLSFGQTLGHEFVNFDDDAYVYQNPEVTGGVTLWGIGRAFADHPFYHWQPLTPLSHMLDCQLFGLNPAGHHFTSLLLHAIVATLLWVALLRMTGDFWPSLLTATLWAVHPLRVETVAWVADRKDLLCGLMFMLTLIAYTAYARRPFALGRYLLVMLLIALGLMAKAMLVTMPFVLLLLDYWPLDRVGIMARATTAGHRPDRRWLVEKLPLLAIVVAMTAFTFYTQQSGLQSGTRFPLTVRIENALVSYVKYMGESFWPIDLTIYYPHPGTSLPAARAWMAGACCWPSRRLQSPCDAACLTSPWAGPGFW